MLVDGPPVPGPRATILRYGIAPGVETIPLPIAVKVSFVVPGTTVAACPPSSARFTTEQAAQLASMPSGCPGLPYEVSQPKIGSPGLLVSKIRGLKFVMLTSGSPVKRNPSSVPMGVEPPAATKSGVISTSQTQLPP